MNKEKFFQACSILCLLLTQIGFAQWTPVNGPAPNVMYLTASGPDIFAQTNTGFFYSSDNGVHWTAANSGFADSLVTAFPADRYEFSVAQYYERSSSSARRFESEWSRD